jgi:SAM-dependent methyltransferase
MKERILESPRFPLCSEEFIDRAVLQLKDIFNKDSSEIVKNALKSDFAQKLRSFKNWFQRIEFPDFNITSTSDHSLVISGVDRLNSLGGRLSLEEAAVLRPLPKWFYLKPILPDLNGKTILEAGSNNGFFSFQFAQIGAKAVTGVEVVKRLYDAACWAAKVLNIDNVQFLNSDLMLDLTIPRHDIVFMSAVHIHFVTFFFGLLRSINLSKELVILDAGIGSEEDEYGLRLHIVKNEKLKRINYHVWNAASKMIIDFLYLVGVEPSRVTRYIGPWGDHVIYFIDTRNVECFRDNEGYPEYIKSFLNLNFKTK